MDRSSLAPFAAALDLVLPRTCAGCDRPGGPICPRCRVELAGLALTERGPLTPTPVPRQWPGCTGTLRYEGVAARLVRALKDEGRRDLVPPLGRLLADAADRALCAPPLAGVEAVTLVPVPSAPAAVRARGDLPTRLLAREAAGLLDRASAVRPVLRLSRRTRDQAALSRTQRAANLSGAMAVTDPGAVCGGACLLVDDVLTSGATLGEGRRALLAAGAADVGLAVVMVTARRHRPTSPDRALPFRADSD